MTPMRTLWYCLLLLPSVHLKSQHWQRAQLLDDARLTPRMTSDSKGNVYIRTQGRMGYGNDPVGDATRLQKIDPAGVVSYTHPIQGRQEYMEVGMAGSDELMVAGFCKDTLVFSDSILYPPLTSYIARLDKDGKRKWSRYTYYMPHSFVTTGSGNVVFVNGDSLECVDPQGKTLWKTSLRFAYNPGCCTAYILGSALGANGHIFLSAAWTGTYMALNNVVYHQDASVDKGFFLIEVDKSGQVLGVEKFGGVSWAYMRSDAAGHIYLLGMLPKGQTIHVRNKSLTESMSTEPNGHSYFMTKLAVNGTCSWLHQIKKYKSDYDQHWNYELAVSSSGNIFIAGFTPDTLQVGSTLLPFVPGLFIAAFDTHSGLLWTNQAVSTTTNLSVQGLNVAGNNAVYVVANFINTVSFGSHSITIYSPMPPYYTESWPGQALAMINNGQLTTGIDDGVRATALDIYPNPGDGDYKIVHGGEMASIRVTDLQGRAVSASCSLRDGLVTITDKKPGVYFIHVTKAHETFVRKVILLP
jgi:hypothetical protein